jgi:deoxyadenosine/deoxycytidine kinase
MIIALEGLPGAGKTTSAPLVAGRIGAEWAIETTGDHQALDQIYDDARRQDLQVELNFLVLHFRAYRALSEAATTVIDFSPVKDLLFAADMLRGTDRWLFDELYGALYEELRLPDIVLYLGLSPKDCHDRVRLRGRSFEKAMSLERLERMERLYRQRLSELGRVVLPVDLDSEMTRDEVADVLVSRLELDRQLTPGSEKRS